MSTLLRHVALVPDDNIGTKLSTSELTKAAAALQKQVVRDFAPLWDVRATVDAFTNLNDVPLGYWPILIGQEGQNGGGVHLDKDNQPYALVDLTPDWTVTASHECLEMLADPFGNRLVAGDSPNPARPGRVEFLVEVCDPCEVPTLGYTVNGVRVSDFYTPQYFDPSGASSPSKSYDYRGHITAPRQVLRGGYLSWREGDGTWYQELFFDLQPIFKSIGKFDKSFGSLRSWIDSTTSRARAAILTQRPVFAQQVLSRVSSRGGEENDLADAAARRRADGLRQDIRTMRKTFKVSNGSVASQPATRAGRMRGGKRTGRGRAK